MGQLFNRSKVDDLYGLMLQEIDTFIRYLRQTQRQPVSLVPACRALEADIVCKVLTIAFSTLRLNLIVPRSFIWIRYCNQSYSILC